MAVENTNKYIAVSYKLYTEGEGEERELQEETAENEPFCFVSNLGMTLDAFEEQIINLPIGEHFDFTLSTEDAYGEYDPAGRQTVPRKIFEINGKLDTRYIYEGAIVPLTSGDGSRFNGLIVKIDKETITVDLNHPLAGKKLNFVGQVVENRPATDVEINDTIKMMSGEGGCGGCGGNCDGDCEGGHCGGEGGCGCGGCH